MGKVLVIGDTCIDEYIYCKCERLCPDAPVPVAVPQDSITSMGMASNVLENIRALGVEADILTNKKIITKTRYVDIDTNQMLVRVDKGEEIGGEEDQMNWELYCPGKYYAIIISDYNKGYIDEIEIEEICKQNTPVFIDTKKRIGEYCQYSTCIKINYKEYMLSIDTLGFWSKNKLIITKDKDGCTYRGKNYPVPPVDIKDKTGAGDTFMAGLVARWIECQNIEDSIKIANLCATQVVQKRGVAVVNLKELKL